MLIKLLLEILVTSYNRSMFSQVITIFSASNYYETGSNKGAYMKLTGQQLTPHFVQFNSAKSVAKALTFRQRVGLVESSAIRELGATVEAHRDQLLKAFKAVDTTDTGITSHLSCPLT